MGNFASVLKQLRIRAGLTQAELAQALGIGKSTISMYEVDAREPDAGTMEKIANYFHVDMNYLYGVEKNEVSLDDFSYALFGETQSLTEENKAKLLEMAKFFKEQQDKS